MVNVPEKYRPHMSFNYPGDNAMIFEEWFYYEFLRLKPQTDRVYLPVFWTSYYVNHSFGKDQRAIADLQIFLNRLDRKKKYFTIVQYDDGILNRLSELDIKVFAMSGARVDYALPLICPPHIYESTSSRRTIIANFVGRRTHPVREVLMNDLAAQKDYLVTSSSMSLDCFCKVLSQSLFTLCPRGYGNTSFRIAEAMQYGSIPVYISDDFVFPHGLDFERYGVVIHNTNAGRTAEILSGIPQGRIAKKQRELKRLYATHFTYHANFDIILNEVR
jgi:exostosin family protein